MEEKAQREEAERAVSRSSVDEFLLITRPKKRRVVPKMSKQSWLLWNRTV